MFAVYRVIKNADYYLGGGCYDGDNDITIKIIITTTTTTMIIIIK